MSLPHVASLEAPKTPRHSRESGNPVRELRCCIDVLDSRFRGNDGASEFIHKISGQFEKVYGVFTGHFVEDRFADLA